MRSKERIRLLPEIPYQIIQICINNLNYISMLSDIQLVVIFRLPSTVKNDQTFKKCGNTKGAAKHCLNFKRV